jgi:protein-S-isoprenylcysteine O-methyltransferase Ste14
MQKYIAAAALLILITTVTTRVLLLKRQGIQAMKFGELDKKDFFIPPFAFFYFYLVFANAFNWPSVIKQQIFYSEIVAWVGVFFCVAAIALIFYSLISFRKSFRVGIDVNVKQELITTGAFAFSRNPMYVAFALVLWGQFLIFPNWILLVYIIAATWLFNRQVLLEEDFLKQHYGAAYADYCKRVRRYI